MNNDKELLFLLKVLRLTIAEGSTLDIPKDLDWERFLFWVDRHRVTGHAYKALESQLIPDEVKNELRAGYEKGVFKSLSLKAEFHKFANILNAEGLDFVSIKGVFLSELLWDDCGRRYAGDIDILVNEIDMIEVHKLLLANQYNCLQMAWWSEQRIKKHLQLSHQIAYEKNGVLIEILRSVKSQFYYEGILDKKNIINYKSESKLVPMLLNEVHFIELCIHGAGHLWSRLHWLMDVAQFLKEDKLDWDLVQKMCRERQVKNLVFDSCYLACTLFGIPQPFKLGDLNGSKLIKRSLREISREDELPKSILEKLRRYFSYRIYRNNNLFCLH